MAWVKFHYDCVQNKKTSRLASALKIQPYAAVGILASLWSWATEYALDGDLTDYSASDIARVVAWNKSGKQLVEALCQCGFIDEQNGRRTIHDWHEYAGRLQEQREQGRKRVAKHREKKAECNALQDRYSNAPCNSNVTLQSKSKSKIDTPPFSRRINGTDDNEEGIKKACQVFADNMTTAYVTAATASAIADWCGIAGPELVIAAIEFAAKRGKKPWGYVESILREWHELGFKTKADAEAHIESRQKQNVIPMDKLAKEKAYPQRDNAGELNELFEQL